MSNQMTTPINNIPIDNNVQPNNDIQDPLVQEILSDMVKSSEKQNVVQKPVQQTPSVQQPITHNINQPIYNYPTQNDNFLSKLYDKKIIILTLAIVTIVIIFHLNQFNEFLDNISNNYVQKYKFYIKYIGLYIVLYIIQKYEF